MERSSHLPFARAVPIALLLALAAPAAARADATLSASGSAPHKTLTFTVNDALGDHLGATADDHLVIDDSRAVPVGGSGSTAIDAQTVDCGPAADFERVVFAFGEGDDRLVLYGNFQNAADASCARPDDDAPAPTARQRAHLRDPCGGVDGQPAPGRRVCSSRGAGPAGSGSR